MKLNLNIKKAGLLVLGVVAGSVVFAQKTDPKGNALVKESTKKDTVNTLNAQQKTSASIADGVSASVLGIRGRIIDVETMKPIAGVSVSLSDNSKVTSTNANGEFIIPVAKKGDYKIVSSYLGYNKEVTPVVLEAKNWETVSVVLVSESSTLDEVVVTRRRVQASEFALLEERKNSNLFVEKIGAQELSRKGVSDAAGAVSQLSGVSRQEGSTQVYVRGLGDRYISTSLNGLPIPASDPNLKNIALDIFTTDVVDYIGVDKSYNAPLSGDFGGASVNIGSKDFKGDRLFEVSVGSSVNTNALQQWNNFYLQDGPNFFGYSDYKAPADVEGSYHFKNGWDPKKKTLLPMNFGIKAGDSFKVGSEGRMSLFAMMDFANGYNIREGVNSSFSAQGAPLKSLSQSQQSYTANTTGMLNANYQINPKHKLTYNFMYVNAGNQYRDVFTGYIRDAGVDAENYRGTINRSTFSSTQLFINQLLGKHTLTDKIELDWGVAYNNVKGDMPDRLQSMHSETIDGDHYFIRVNAGDNHRYSHFLKENELAANIATSYKLGDNRGKLTVGYSGKKKELSFNVMQLNFNILDGQQNTTKIDPSNLDQYLGASGYGSFYNLIGLAGNAFQYYNGDQDIHAGFATMDYKLTDRLTGVLGVRYENIKQYVDFYSIEYSRDKSTLTKNGLLPSLNLKYELNANNNLRLGASKTYTLPQFKERALFSYDDVTQRFFGNPHLYASDNYNVDLKWEMFPREGELYSVTGFGKYIENPINEIVVSSTSNDISYANTGDKGYVYGIELEAKKYLLNLTNDKLSIGFNTAVMKTDQKFNPNKVLTETDGLINIDPTNMSSKFTGASDFIVNADLSYLKSFDANRNLSATILYNYYSDKLNAIGTGGRGNLMDKGLGTLDFVLKSKVTKHLGVDLAARNILNPSFERWQQNETPVKVMSYKRGASFSLGVNYKF
ncbi:TonB-dependent receptor [Sphingobacterium paucimobilis]|uniref:TonB-dependent receptor plug domain-containing protein n=1 Tax=Sphingobacterium paucimobilis HER1398 TaxID=1346330 RepID=U2J6F6_9SPHI|nr:TonB-dependent receptor [Sphingobacterium paucimobilis]ERJ60499.1 hypothetical protein M472_17250 [Sphingobacterium paucimobilis HER1398]